jgi:steroid delta-isomerase-like uncharacterized protein
MASARRVVEQWFDALNRSDLDGSLAYLADDVEWSNPVASVRGRDEVRALFEGYWTALPDFQHTIAAILDDGEIVAVEGMAIGTHTGPLVGPQGEVPATGRRVEFPYCCWARVEDGKVRRFQGYWDVAGFMTQLGLMPEPAGATA